MSYKAKILFYLILISGIFLRIYNFTNSVSWDTDRSLAFLIAERIINYQHILFIGPITSLYPINILPPTYYYFIAFLIFLFRSEVIVTFIYSLFGVISIWLIFLITKKIINSKTALIASFLYSFSGIMVSYSRSIWEPHLLPFLILLSINILLFSLKTNKIIFVYIGILIFYFSFMYISSYLLMPGMLLLSFWILLSITTMRLFSIVTAIYFHLFSFLIFYIPVIFFEYQKNFETWKKIPTLFTSRNDGIVVSNIIIYITSFWKQLQIFFNSILYLENQFVINIFIVIFVFVTCYIFFQYRQQNKYLYFIFFPFISSLILISLYSKDSYAHRWASIYPIFFVLFALIIYNIYEIFTIKINRIIITLLITGFIVYTYLITNTVEISADIYHKKPLVLHQFEVANFIAEYANKSPFTIYVITPDNKYNYFSVDYWYILEKIKKQKLIELDENGNFIDTFLDKYKKYIFLICRDFISVQESTNMCLEYFTVKEGLTPHIGYQKVDTADIYIFNGL